jgi:hypothetical protein
MMMQVDGYEIGPIAVSSWAWMDAGGRGLTTMGSAGDGFDSLDDEDDFDDEFDDDFEEEWDDALDDEDEFDDDVDEPPANSV